MAHCSACFKDNIISNLRTIGDQIVCSLACIGLLNSNEKDSCDYCHRPVWRDSYYKVNNKFYCTEMCKDKIISELKIPYDSKSIQYFQENIFFNNDNNTDSDFNNSKQLREEVLKFYKDFKFDTIIQNDNIYIKKESNSSKKSNKNENEYLSDSSKGNHRYFKRIKKQDTQEGKNISSKNETNVEENIDNSKSKNYVGTATNTLDDRNSLKKAYTSKNFQNKEDNINRLKYRTKRTKVDRLNKNKYNTYIDYNYGKEKVLNNDKSLPNELFSNNLYLKKNEIKSYSFINNINYPNSNNNTRNLSSNSKSNFNSIKTNVSHSSSKGLNYININKTNSVRKDAVTNYCCFCGNELGRSSFLDRKGNHFCSDYCKEEFLKNGY